MVSKRVGSIEPGDEMTEKKRMPFIRCFTMLMLLLGVMGMMVVSATAAPGDGSKAQLAGLQVADVTLDVCITLLDAGLIGVDGTGVGDTDLAATDLPAGIVLDVTALASVNAGECGLVEGFPPVPGGELTLAICDGLDLSNDGDVDTTEAVGISIDLDGDGDVDAGDQPFADEQCDAMLGAVPGANPTNVDGTTDVTQTEAGSLVINNFACPQVEEPVAVVSDPGAADTSGGAPKEGCTATATDFEIFVNGVFTSVPIAVSIDGSGTIPDVPATQDGVPHALFDRVSNVYFNIQIAPGEVTTATVLNPADDGNVEVDTSVAGGAADNAGGVSAPDGNAEVDTSVAGGAADNAGGVSAPDGNASKVASATDDDDAEGSIIGLPSTGQGGDGGVNGSVLVLVFGTISMVTLVGGFAWRQRRTC